MDLWLPPKPAIIIPADKKLLRANLPIVAPPFFKVAVTATAVAYGGAATDGSTSAPGDYTHTAVPCGAAAAGRYLLATVVFATATGATVNTVTIGGVAATKILGPFSGGAFRLSMWIALVPSGTTADVAITLTNSANEAQQRGVSLFALTNLQSATPTATQNVVTTTQNYSTSINVQANGVAIGVRAAQTSNASSFTWTGLTERFDSQLYPNVSGHSGASGAFATAQSPLAITCNANAAPSSSVLGIVAMR